MDKFNLNYLSPLEYQGVEYASLSHAYYATRISDPNIKWYLINSQTTRELDIVSKNFADFLDDISEEEDNKILNELLKIKLSALSKEIEEIKEKGRIKELPLLVQDYLQGTENEYFNG